MPGWDEFNIVPKAKEPPKQYGSAIDQFDLDLLDRLRGPQVVENRAVNAAKNFIQTGMNNFDNLGPIKEQISELDPDIAQRERGKLSGIGRDMVQGAGAINKVKNNVPDAAPLISQEQEKHPVLKQVVAPIAKGLEYLDNVTSRPVRAATYPGGGYFDWEAAKDSKDWNKAVRADPIGAPIAKGFDAAMAPVAGVVGAPLVGVGALADAYSGKDLPTISKNAFESSKGMAESAGDFGMSAMADWTNLFSLGLGGAAKSVVAPVTRAALKAGKTAQEAARIAQDVEAIAKFNFPVAEKAKYVTDLLKAEGLPQVFGETAQHLGKGQLRVGLDIPGQIVEQVGKAVKSPGLESFGAKVREGIDVIPTLTGKEFAGADALDKVMPKVKALTLPPLSPPAQQAFSFMPAPTPPIPQKPLLWSQRGQQKEIIQEGLLKQKGAINASTVDVMNDVVAGAKASGQSLKIDNKFLSDLREAGRTGVQTDEIAKSKQSLIDLAQQNGLPLDHRALSIIEDFHQSHNFASASAWLKSVNLPTASKLATGLEWLTARLRRRMLTLSPANNTINVANDLVQASTAGMNNIPLRLSQGAAALDATKPLEIGGKVYQPGELRTLANEFNIGLENVNKDVLNKKLGSLSKGSNVRILDDAVSGGLLDRLPDKVAQKIPMTMQFQHRWEDLSKMALFIERLDRGDAPLQAAKMVFNTLMDYNDLNKVQQIAKWFLPFVTWTSKMPTVAGRALVRNPAAFQRPFKAAQAFGGEEKYDPSTFRQEQGTSIPLSPRGEQVMGELSGLEGKNLGQTRVRARIPMDEGLSPWASLISEGNIKPFLSQAGMGSRTVIGGGLDIDTVTGKPIDKSTGDLVAEALPSLLFSRPMQAALNYGIYKAHGGKEAGANPAPLSPYGKPTANPEAKQLEQVLGLLGAGIFKSLPTDQLYNQLDAGELQKLLTRVKNLTSRNDVVKTVKKGKQ